MHELGITQNIIAIVEEHAGGAQVRKVRLEIGRLSAVVPDAIKFCFDVCAKGTKLEGAELEIEEIDGRGLCGACGSQVPLTLLVGRCECGSADVKCIAGMELKVKNMEVE